MGARTTRAIAAELRPGRPLSRDAALGALTCQEALPDVFAAAAAVRDARWGRRVTYSPKVFLPITNLCRDRCTYCTFRKDPEDPGAWTMEVADVRMWSERGRRLGCREALLCLGDKPELAYASHRRWLRDRGHASTAAYVAVASRVALDAGLLPHTNAGILTAADMARLRPLNVSLGLMLESIAPRLRQRGHVHQWAPDKDPAVRLRMIHEAGELRIPFTTGILLGIGETVEERVDSLLAIRDAHRRHGHIQEVIVQNFRAKPTIAAADAPEPTAVDVARTVAVARLVLDAEIAVQAPPNLSPADHALLLAAGLNDWGGISPLTPDYVNPEAPWPHVEALARTCADAGFALVERLPIYPAYAADPTFVDPALRPHVEAHQATLRPVAPAEGMRA